MPRLSQTELNDLACGRNRHLLDPSPLHIAPQQDGRIATNARRWRDTCAQQIAARWVLFFLFLFGCAFALRAGLRLLGLSS